KYGRASQWWTRSQERLQKVFSHSASEQILNTTVLAIIGTGALAPIKWLEDKKPQVVEKFNQWLGEPDAIEIVKHEPKQTWWSLVKSRVVTYATVWASF